MLGTVQKSVQSAQFLPPQPHVGVVQRGGGGVIRRVVLLRRRVHYLCDEFFFANLIFGERILSAFRLSLQRGFCCCWAGEDTTQNRNRAPVSYAPLPARCARHYLAAEIEDVGVERLIVRRHSVLYLMVISFGERRLTAQPVDEVGAPPLHEVVLQLPVRDVLLDGLVETIVQRAQKRAETLLNATMRRRCNQNDVAVWVLC